MNSRKTTPLTGEAFRFPKSKPPVEYCEYRWITPDGLFG